MYLSVNEKGFYYNLKKIKWKIDDNFIKLYFGTLILSCLVSHLILNHYLISCTLQSLYANKI